MSLFQSRALACAFSVSVLSSASATQFASSVSSYNVGSYSGGYSVGASAVGSPDPLTGVSGGFPNILSPFSPAYESNQLAGIGKGGHLTLSFANPVHLVNGPEVGVVTNIGLWDSDYPSGTSQSPAATFNDLPRIADAEVSADGVNFQPVSRITFENPANYFANAADPYAGAAPTSPVPADFGKPFTGSLSSFSGRTWPQTLSLLDGSGGGTWINVEGTTLTQFSYIRFSIPSAGINGADNQLFVDSVSANNAAVVWFPGDASIDNQVNTLDFNILAGKFGAANDGWTAGDFNFDGLTDSQDFSILLGHYGQSAATGSLGTVVPEPTSLAALSLAALILRRRR